MTTTRYWRAWPRYTILLLVTLGGLAFALPLWWSIVWGNWHTTEIFSFPPKLIPGPYFLDNIMRLQQRLGIWGAFRNSVTATALSMTGALFFCSLAGFAFAKYKFRLREVFFYVLLATMAVPGQITAIPLFIIMVKLHWVDSIQGLVVPGLVPAFGVFLMRMSIEEAIPDELLEAARMDGANELRNFFQIALPNILPHMAALSIFMFTGSWGSLFWPLIVLRTTAKFTLPVALSSIIGSYEQPYDMLMAGSLIALIPPLVVFFSTQRFFMKSLIAGAFR